MGLDGGTKISRSDVIRGASWRLTKADNSRSTRGGAISTHALLQAEEADPKLIRQSRLSHCRVSNAPLQPPVVCDLLGNLYNKAALLEYLLGRKHGAFASAEAKTSFENVQRTSGDTLNHLKGVKDVFEVHCEADTRNGHGGEPPLALCGASHAEGDPHPDSGRLEAWVSNAALAERPEPSKDGVSEGERATPDVTRSHVGTGAVDGTAPSKQSIAVSSVSLDEAATLQLERACSALSEVATGGATMNMQPPAKRERQSDAEPCGKKIRTQRGAYTLECPLCGTLFHQELDVVDLAADVKADETQRAQLARRSRHKNKQKREGSRTKRLKPA